MLPGGNINTVGHLCVGNIGLGGDGDRLRHSDWGGRATECVSPGGCGGGGKGEVTETDTGGDGSYQESGGESKGS